MGKRIFSLFVLIFPFISIAQVNSWDGYTLSPYTKGRVLNIFINVIYDVHPDTVYCPSTIYWPTATREGINNDAIPSYLLDFMDTAYNAQNLHGTLTRLYGESSFNSLQLTGDFVVVNVNESSVLQRYHNFSYRYLFFIAVNFINDAGGLQTIYGHNTLTDYLRKGDTLIGTNILIRNINRQYGGLSEGSGLTGHSGGPRILIDGTRCRFSNSTIQCIGSENIAINPSSIVVHEISHLFFGSNDFHTSGGNHRGIGCSMSFPCLQYGYGLMGAGGSGLVGCNGYERWRMHWRHPDAIDYISAQNLDLQSVPSDISIKDGEQTFILRDFVEYGDAVRIKLPYKDTETSSEQYIWLENHQIGYNNKLDFLKYSNDSNNDCRPKGCPGIYAYYQVGRDLLSGGKSQVFDNFDRDNLKIIPAEGYFDYALMSDSYKLECVSYETLHHTMIQGEANPFCGGQDQQRMLFPLKSQDLLTTENEYPVWRVIKNGQNIDSLICLGDDRDAFATKAHLNMGTNPSSCNTITCHSNNNEIASTLIYSQHSEKDTRHTYLTGLGIDITPMDGHIFKVRVRWNDYDIINDTRWTGNIVLQDTARLSNGKTITLAQNKTVTQVTRDRQTKLFTTRTTLTCRPSSYFHLAPQSSILLTENSTLSLDSASTVVLESGACINIQSGSTLRIDTKADLQLLGNAQIIVKSSGTLIIQGFKYMESSTKIIVHQGGKLIVDGVTLTKRKIAHLNREKNR